MLFARRQPFSNTSSPSSSASITSNKAGFEQMCRLEDFDWSAELILDAVFSMEFLARKEHVLLVGPVGVGKTFLAHALGYTRHQSGTLRALCPC